MATPEEISAASQAIYHEMINDLILSVSMSAHREVKRSKVPCGVCGEKCREHKPTIPDSGNDRGEGSSSSSVVSQPTSLPGSNNGNKNNGYTVGPEKGTGGSTGIGSGSGRPDASGNVFFDCLVCGRATASTRYAPHLSSCLGLNGGTRRKAARNATAKNRLGANDRYSPSPYYQGSENGDSDDDSVSSKKQKKANGIGKRAKSPGRSSSVKASRPGSGNSTPIPPSSRPALPPSKLGRPPTSNRPVDAVSVSSTSSHRSDVVLQGSQMASISGKAGAGSNNDDVMEVDPGDDSSEGADDY